MLSVILRLYAIIFSRECFIKFNKLLYSMAIRGLGVYNYQNMKMSGEENFIKEYISEYAKRKEHYIVFDIGANRGEFLKKIVSAVDNAVIYAYEPHPKTFESLKENTKSINCVNLFNLAVSDKNTRLMLYDYEDSDGSAHASLNSEIFTIVYKSNTISHEVDVTTVDTIVKENNLASIDFLKIDVEGNELSVLRGAKKQIGNSKISIIQFEFTQLNTTTKVFFKDIYEILSDKYDIFRLLPHGLLKIKSYDPTMNEIFGYQNYVAILRGHVNGV